MLLNSPTNVYKEETFLWELEDDPRQCLKIFYNLCRIMVSSSSSCFPFLFRFCREKVGMHAFTFWGEAEEQLERGRKGWGVCSQKVNEWVAGLLSIAEMDWSWSAAGMLLLPPGTDSCPGLLNSGSRSFREWSFFSGKIVRKSSIWNQRPGFESCSHYCLWLYESHFTTDFFNCKNLINGYPSGLGGLTITCSTMKGWTPKKLTNY